MFSFKPVTVFDIAYIIVMLLVSHQVIFDHCFYSVRFFCRCLIW